MNARPNPRGLFSLPHERMAWTAVWLTVAFLVMTILNIASGNDLAFLMFLAMLAMLGALGLSTVAIVRHGERSLLALLPLVVGAAVVVFFAVELLAGHA